MYTCTWCVPLAAWRGTVRRDSGAWKPLRLEWTVEFEADINNERSA